MNILKSKNVNTLDKREKRKERNQEQILNGKELDTASKKEKRKKTEVKKQY